MRLSFREPSDMNRNYSYLVRSVSQIRRSGSLPTLRFWKMIPSRFRERQILLQRYAMEKKRSGEIRRFDLVIRNGELKILATNRDGRLQYLYLMRAQKTNRIQSQWTQIRWHHSVVFVSSHYDKVYYRRRWVARSCILCACVPGTQAHLWSAQSATVHRGSICKILHATPAGAAYKVWLEMGEEMGLRIMSRHTSCLVWSAAMSTDLHVRQHIWPHWGQGFQSLQRITFLFCNQFTKDAQFVQVDPMVGRQGTLLGWYQLQYPGVLMSVAICQICQVSRVTRTEHKNIRSIKGHTNVFFLTWN